MQSVGHAAGRAISALFAALALLALPGWAQAATHTYWRIEITADQSCFAGGNHFANIDDIKFYDAGGAAIATTGGTATDSGNFSSSAANLFDSNAGTLDSINTNGLYGVGPNPVFAQYQFASPVEPIYVRIMGTGGGGGFGCVSGQGASAFTIKYSDNGSAFTSVGSVSGYDSTSWPAHGSTPPAAVNGTAHRYWSALQIRAKTTQEPDAAEIELHATPGGSDLSGCTAISSSDLGGFPKTNAHDSNNATFWVSNTTTFMTSYIGCDYGVGVTKTVNEFKWRVRNDAFATNEGSKDFVVRYSDDGSTWTVQWTVWGEADWSAGEARTYTNPAYSGASTARHRLLMH